MSDAEILKKALNRAVKNGYKKRWDYGELRQQCWQMAIIFDHDFAKAFWREEQHTAELDVPNSLCFSSCDKCKGDMQDYEGIDFCWKYHLQQMVLEENPIKYLEKFI